MECAAMELVAMELVAMELVAMHRAPLMLARTGSYWLVLAV